MSSFQYKEFLVLIGQPNPATWVAEAKGDQQVFIEEGPSFHEVAEAVKLDIEIFYEQSRHQT